MSNTTRLEPSPSWSRQALLLNAMMPTLAAIDLAEINANTLVRDAYVQVILNTDEVIS